MVVGGNVDSLGREGAEGETPVAGFILGVSPGEHRLHEAAPRRRMDNMPKSNSFIPQPACQSNGGLFKKNTSEF